MPASAPGSLDLSYSFVLLSGQPIDEAREFKQCIRQVAAIDKPNAQRFSDDMDDLR
jgi:hypothetical protein